MIKKIMAVLMTFVLSMSLVGCSNDSSDKKTTPKKTTTSSSIKIKDVSDFQEFDGMIKYFTMDDKKIAIPETVGENPTKKTISVAEASVTFIEVKYDEYAEEEYDKAAKGIEVETSEGTLALNNKVKYAQVRKLFGDPEQETDGRFHYTDDAGYKYMFDCCNENRNGIFRGFSIEYPSK